MRFWLLVGNDFFFQLVHFIRTLHLELKHKKKFMPMKLAKLKKNGKVFRWIRTPRIFIFKSRVNKFVCLGSFQMNAVITAWIKLAKNTYWMILFWKYDEVKFFINKIWSNLKWPCFCLIFKWREISYLSKEKKTWTTFGNFFLKNGV